MRKLILAPLFAAAVALGAPSVAMAAPNDQSGLVNVNLDGISAAVPVSVAVPIGVALNVCDVSILALQDQTGDMTCTATNNSLALSRAFAVAATDPNGGGPNRQSGLVNVSVTNIALAIPASVAVPVGVAANVCGVSVLSLQEMTGDRTCTAENTSTALSEAIARALVGQ